MRGNRVNRVAQSGTIAAMSPTPRVLTGASTKPYVPYVTKDGRHVYATLFGTGAIAMFSRDGAGALTPLSTPTITANYGPWSVAEWTDGNGSFIYVTSSGADLVRVFTRNVATGVLTVLNTYACGPTPMGIAISPDGAYLYVANKAAAAVPTVSQFARNTNGTLTALSTAKQSFGVSDCEPHGIVMVGTNVYVGTFVGSQIYALTQGAGGLLSVAATPSYTAGNEPAWLAASPDGKSLYAANDASASISQFAVNADGTLTSLGAALPTGGGPFSVAVTPDGKHVYTGDSDNQTITMFSRDTATGVLTPKTPARERSDPYVAALTGSAGPQYVTVSPDGQNLYAGSATAQGHAVWQFHIRP